MQRLKMLELYLELKLKTPLLITSGKVGESFRSLDYIPGSTLRGTIAGLMISGGMGTDSEQFKDIFINGAVKFGNLYYKYSDEDIIHYPLPLSRYHCKADKKHLYLDCLKKPIPEECPECHSRMVNKPISLGIKKIISMHNAIDSKTQTTEEGKLFSYELIREGQSFSGRIRSSEKNYLEQIKGLLDKNKEGFYIGKGNSRGLGEIEVVKAQISESKPNIGQIEEGFTLTLLSDAILMDEDGRFLRTLTGKYLGIDDVVVEKAFARTKNLTLWNSAADLPREAVVVIVAGSCFAFGFNSNPSEKVKERLFSLELEGIGIRREQGFGEVRINDKRHDEAPLPVIKEEKPEEKKKTSVEEFYDEVLKQIKGDEGELKKVNKPSALFKLISFANNKDFETLQETIEQQIKRDKSIFKKIEINDSPFGKYIKENILVKCERDIKKARAGLLALCRVVQAYRKE
jgi:CRISPR/Cas system CSM-associated protein Csm3 (group 7 of RAMP superfamily)